MRSCPLFICEKPNKTERCVGLIKNIYDTNERLAKEMEEYHERRITEESD